VGSGELKELKVSSGELKLGVMVDSGSVGNSNDYLCCESKCARCQVDIKALESRGMKVRIESKGKGQQGGILIGCLEKFTYTPQARRNFKDSNFRKLYRSCPKAEITQEKVLDGLKKVLPAAAEVLKERLKQYSLLDACVWLYTTNHIYRQLNASIIRDDETETKDLVHFMWLIRAINSGLATPLNESILVYRGSRLSKEQTSTMKEGTLYRFSMFASTTMFKKVALQFKVTVLLELNIPKGCLNACKIQHLSQFGAEGEVLLPPYTLVKCVSKSDDVIRFDVLDNLIGTGDNNEKDSTDIGFVESICCAPAYPMNTSKTITCNINPKVIFPRSSS